MKKISIMLPVLLFLVSVSGCLTGNSGTLQGGGGADSATRLSDATLNSVFEIVALRPVDSPDVARKKTEEGRDGELRPDTVTYAREIPWQNVDYNDRNDEYIAYGTAFAVSERELVTAAHVLQLTGPSFFDRLFIRTREGKVYEIDSITRYSTRRDFAFFTVKTAPAFKPLPLQPDFKINETVFSVGNALGKGIIFREGLLTSTEKEGEKGAWSYLLFSAPASPGNSGGPLMDARGNVIGIILRKTENENLNYALPVSEFAQAPTDGADLGRQITYGFINTTRKYGPLEREESIPLPMGYPLFREKYVARFTQIYRDMVAGFHKENSTDFFPEGDRAEEMFQWVGGVSSLSLYAEGKDGSWGIVPPGEMKSGRLGRSGDVTWGSFSYLVAGELKAPEDIALADLYADTDLLGNLFLKGYTLNREIGGDSVRITSLGKPTERRLYRDRWGRTWIRGVWSIPFADSAMVLYLLPTPEGFAFLGYIGNYAFAMMDLTVDIEFYLDYACYTYKGSYRRWAEFLAQKEYLPDSLQTVRFSYVDAGSVELETEDFHFRFGSERMDITDESRMELVVAPIRDSNTVAWKPTGFSVQAHKGYGDSYLFWRSNQPQEFLSENYQENWLKICRRINPYSREKFVTDGSTFLIDIDPVARSLEVEKRIALREIYIVSAGAEGDKDQQTMEERLSAFERAVILKERRD